MSNGAYKGDLEAAHARIQALEQENRALKNYSRESMRPAQILEFGCGLPAALGARAEEQQQPSRAWRTATTLATATLVVIAVGGAVMLARVGGPRGAAIGIGLLALIALPLWIVFRLFRTCGPNEALVISGRPHRGSDGIVRGYRIVRGGRVLRLPFLERVDRLDLGPVHLDVAESRVFTRGGQAVDLQASAAVRVACAPPLLHNAIERFLGRDRRELAQVARDTLAGNLRAVAAVLSIDELGDDSRRAASMIVDQAGHDLERLGLVLEGFDVQSVRLAS